MKKQNPFEQYRDRPKDSKLGQRLTLQEKDFIRENCTKMTDKELSHHLNRKIDSVVRYRRKVGIFKGQRGAILVPSKEAQTDLLNIGVTSQVSQSSHILNPTSPNASMDDDQRKRFYQTQFTSSLYYANIKQQFTREEISFYLDEWGALCLQFEDILATEKRQLDQYIKLTIMGMRLLKHISIIDNEIQLVQDRVAKFRRENPTVEDDAELQEQDEHLMQMISMMNVASTKISGDYTKNVEATQKLFSDLKARRKDRMEQITKKGVSFLAMVEEFQNTEVRRSQDRHAELLKMAKEKKQLQWRRPNKFEDGTKDCILLDDKSLLPEEEIIVSKDRLNSKIFEALILSGGKRVLILDKDPERAEFYSDRLKNHKVVFASNSQMAHDALEKTHNYYVIIIGHKDLEPFINDVMEQNILGGSYFLVTTEDMDFQNRMEDYFELARSYEICEYKNIVENFGEKNAKESST